MDFEYILQNMAGPGVDPAELEESFQGCKCVAECSTESGCSCLIDGKVILILNISIFPN